MNGQGLYYRFEAVRPEFEAGITEAVAQLASEEGSTLKDQFLAVASSVTALTTNLGIDRDVRELSGVVGSPEISTSRSPLRAASLALQEAGPQLVTWYDKENKDQGIGGAWLLDGPVQIKSDLSTATPQDLEVDNGLLCSGFGEPGRQSWAFPAQGHVVSFSGHDVHGREIGIMSEFHSLNGENPRLIFRGDRFDRNRRIRPHLGIHSEIYPAGRAMSQEDLVSPGFHQRRPTSHDLSEFVASVPSGSDRALAEVVKAAHFARAYDTEVRSDQVIPEQVMDRVISDLGNLSDLSQRDSVRFDGSGGLHVRAGKAHFDQLNGKIVDSMQWLFGGVELPYRAQEQLDRVVASA